MMMKNCSNNTTIWDTLLLTGCSFWKSWTRYPDISPRSNNQNVTVTFLVPWQRNHGGENHHNAITNLSLRTRIPMDVFSIDQMMSMQFGFIAQSKTMLNKSRYRAATIFVGNFSRPWYKYFVTNKTSVKTVMAKKLSLICRKSWCVCLTFLWQWPCC